MHAWAILAGSAAKQHELERVASLTADEAKLHFDSTSQPEFDRWRWADYWTPVREVVYFKRRVYVRALHDLGRLIYPDGLPPYPEWWPRSEQQRAGATHTSDG